MVDRFEHVRGLCRGALCERGSGGQFEYERVVGRGGLLQLLAHIGGGIEITTFQSQCMP